MAENDWEIVPERDDALIQSRKVKTGEPRRPNEPKKGGDREAVAARNGDSMALWGFIFLLVFGSLGANVYLYLSLTDMQAENLALDTRVIDLESKLSVTDESVTQSGAALQAILREQGSELELHMSEIRKLWAAYQRFEPAITDLERKAEQATQQLSGLASLTSRFTTVQQRVESMGSQSLVLAADIEEMNTRVRQATDSINAVQTSLRQLQTQNQQQAEAIEAIDAFRLQINQRILRLEAPPSPTP